MADVHSRYQMTHMDRIEGAPEQADPERTVERRGGHGRRVYGSPLFPQVRRVGSMAEEILRNLLKSGPVLAEKPGEVTAHIRLATTQRN